jgi:NADH-quinone oxidoreductase subunit J
MSFLFVIAAATLVSAIAAMTLRSLVHCALFAALTFGGLAGLYLELGAQFVGFAQILVYVGAVAILIVFAILLTRGSEPSGQPVMSSSWWWGVLVAVLVAGSLIWAVLASPLHLAAGIPKADVSNDAAVHQIGTGLMTQYVVPLEIVALLLTAATIGAVIIAMQEKDVQG